MNSLIEIIDMEPPYVVQVVPCGCGSQAVMSKDGKNLEIVITERGTNEKPLVGVKTPILSDGVNEGYLTITRDDLVAAKKLCREKFGNAPLMTIDCYVYLLESCSRSDYLTFFKSERICCQTYADVISYLHGLIENGLSIEKIIVNEQEWFATRDEQLAVVEGRSVTPMVWPDGEVNHTLKLTNNSVLPYINNNVYDQDDMLIYDKTTKVILSQRNEPVKPFEYCPCCGGELYTMAYKKYCYSKSCSSLVEAFIESLSKQTGEPKRELYDLFQSGGMIEKVSGPSIDSFRTIVDMVGIDYLSAISSYFKEPFCDVLIERAVELYMSFVSNNVSVTPPMNSMKVLVCSDYSGVSAGTLSLLLRREGYEITTCLEEASFVIAGDVEHEFESFVNDDSNKLIVKVPPKELMRILKK